MKKIFGSIALLAIAAVAAFNVNVSLKSNNLSDVSLANVEALALGGEETDSVKGYLKKIDSEFQEDEVINEVPMTCTIKQTSCIGEGGVFCTSSYFKLCFAKK